ncbi:hypothetical protein E6C67_08150 [Azospirillum sp. TSA2s]|uniref:hypothetical protein n=1 Tax=Azospirillum sp. TSA2s TaxID=709810 RepID=UPI0010AAAFE0|nr:hypothetical protein [Azospirillum sp. TSA2s]QCG93912.1 hypothetical protein E6C67_08150 [Azospirillum sp. TSA2s]
MSAITTPADYIPRRDGTFLPDAALSNLRHAALSACAEYTVKDDPFGFQYRCEACGEKGDHPYTIDHTDKCWMGAIYEAVRAVDALATAQYDDACNRAKALSTPVEG